MIDEYRKLAGIREAWDRSVLGLSKADLDDMDDDERKAACADELNRAADLLQALGAAFHGDLSSSDRATLKTTASTIIKTARGLRPVR